MSVLCYRKILPEAWPISAESVSFPIRKITPWWRIRSRGQLYALPAPQLGRTRRHARPSVVACVPDASRLLSNKNKIKCPVFLCVLVGAGEEERGEGGKLGQAVGVGACVRERCVTSEPMHTVPRGACLFCGRADMGASITVGRARGVVLETGHCSSIASNR